MKISTPLLVILLIVAVGLHASVLTHDLPTLAKNDFLYDDSFYAFQIARNIAHGNGPTFDGTTPTNGYQPLYVALLVPLYLIAPDSNLPIYLALALLALCSLATAVVMYKIILRYARPIVALLAASIWAVSPVVMRQAANGLETAIAGLLLASTIYYYLAHIRSRLRPPMRSFLALGVLLGLSVLARVDLGLFALILALDYLVVMRSRDPRSAVAGVLASAGAAFAVCLPWLAYSITTTGTAILESGTATRFLSLAYAKYFHLAPTEMATTGPDAGFMWAHVARSLSVMKVSPPAHVAFRMLAKLGVPMVVANLGGIVALAGFGWWILRRRRVSPNVRELDFLLLFSVALIASYAFYVFGIFFYLRYLFPIYVVATLYFAVLLEDVAGRLERSPVPLRTVATALFLVYFGATVYMSANARLRSTPQFHFYEVAQWIAEHTDENDTVGAFQSGTIGYVSGRRVINLDGKVNCNARHALEHGELAEYVRDAGVDVIVDHREFLKMFLGVGTDHGPRVVRDNRFRGADYGASGWVAYRLPKVAGGGSARSLSGPHASRPPQ